VIVTAVFLSYRHESDAHRAQVLNFAKLLRLKGLHVVLDQFFLDENRGGPDEGWPAWSISQAKRSEKMLIIGSPGWYRCYEGTEVPGSGRGAAAEAHIIAQRIYNASGLNTFARLVVFDSTAKSGVPLDLQGYHCFHALNDFDGIVGWVMGTQTATPASTLSWPPAPPLLDWQPADSEPVREAFTRLLTIDTPHRVLLICGLSGTGKSHLTRACHEPRRFPSASPSCSGAYGFGCFRKRLS
jgi:hypothetical protein